MAKNIRFGDYVQAVTVDSDSISYSKLIPKPKLDKNGNEIPMKPEKMKLAGTDIYNLLQPYLSVRFMEQVSAVFPLAAYLVLFQIIVLQRSVMGATEITAGLIAVIVGLMIFMEGLKLGLMPFGDIIGNTLPKKLPLVGVLAVAGLLGIGVTYAEPAIGTLKLAGSLVDPEKAPALYYLLMVQTEPTVLLVGIGVGLAAIIGTMRFLYDWSLKPLIYISLIPGTLLTAYCALDSNLASIVGLAWDCGAVTTGPVTVPLVLALGIGVASSGGKGDSSLSGFGIVTLASIFPIVAVLSLGVYYGFTVSIEEMKAANAVVFEAAKNTTGGAMSMWDQILMGPIKDGVQAIVPLVIFLMFILFGVLRSRLPNAFIICYGLVLSVVGMCIFNIGLKYGLSALGEQAGNVIPGSFANITLPESLRLPGEDGVYGPLYGSFWGIIIAGLFAWILGFGGAVQAVEGFGILAAASIAPICAVLALGVYVQYKVKKELAAAQA